MTRRRWLMMAAIVIAVFAGACADDPASGEATVEVVAENLLNPIGLAMLLDGGLLVAEAGTGNDDTSAGVSLVLDNRVERVVSGLPSSRDSGDLSGAPLVGVSPDGTTVYTAHFGGGRLLTFPKPSLEAVDAGALLGPADLGETMVPLNSVQLINPFDIAFTADGVPVVTDASGNGVAIETADGATEFIHRFGQLSDPENESLQIDPVPTGIALLGSEYLVTLTGGCPYPDGAGRLVAIDDARGERIIVDGLNMPIDVAVGPDDTVWLLEFGSFDPDASCFTGEGYESGTGRLSRLEGDDVETVVDGLDYPGAVMVAPDGSLYVTEVFAGRVLRVVPDGVEQSEADTAVDPASPWRFVEVATEAGVDFTHGAFQTALSEDPVAMMGGGVCWIDIEADGDLDLYLVNSHALAEVDHLTGEGGLPTNAMYRNDDGAFVDVSDESDTSLAMRGNGCLAADFDGDNDTDLYVTADGPNALLMNDGEGRFSEDAVAAGVAATGWSTAAVAGDLDGDGLVDLFVGSYIDLEKTIDKPSGAFPQDYLGVFNHLYMNQGDGTFVDVAGRTVVGRDDRTLGALLSDLDGDGDLDLYVANDGQPNYLYENDTTVGEAVRFIDVTGEAAVGDSGSGMGVAGGDYDGDGAPDLMVTNWEAEVHALYRNTTAAEGLTFRYSTNGIGFAGLGSGETGWGTGWADLDHDTDLDLLIANGRVPITDLDTDPEVVRLLGNLTAEGTPGEFRDWTVRTGLDAIGPRLSRGAALADFDNDGDLDVAINQIAGPAVLLRNDGPPGDWLTIVPEPATPGVVARVELDNGTTLVRELHAGSSYLASEDPRLHFGLGTATPALVTVTWPNGEVVELSDVSNNTFVVASGSRPAG